MSNTLIQFDTESEDASWIHISDIMSGLMMVFMAIAVFFMIRVQEPAKIYKEVRHDLHDDLFREFREDLPKWNAVITDDLVVRFKEPDVLFDLGQATLKPRFQDILYDFFPRYVRLLGQEKYRDHITEVRIEGHTSSVWNQAVSGDDAYLRNMKLSQERTRAVLEYVFLMDDWTIKREREWLRSRITANGLSSSHLIRSPSGQEDQQLSQRVEFRVRTDAEEQIESIYRL